MENAADAVSKLFGKTSKSESESTTNESSNTSAPPASDAFNASNSADVNTQDGNASKSSYNDREVDTDESVAPSIEHTHVKKQHETEEQTFIDRQKHQDHYHTTIQPLKDSEIKPEKHEDVQETENRNVIHDDNEARLKAESERAGFESTKDEKKFESRSQKPTVVNEDVHHHLHETVQPVIEKEVIVPEITHKRIDIKERVQEKGEYEGVSTNEPISIEEFEKKRGAGN